MSKTIKILLFSLIGFAVFAVGSFIINQLIIFSLGFLVLSYFTLISYLFRKIKTKHLYLKTSLCALIGIIGFLSNDLLLKYIASRNKTEIISLPFDLCNISILINDILIQLVIFSLVIGAIILGFEFIMKKLMGFVHDENNISIKLFRFFIVGVLCFNISGSFVPLLGFVNIVMVFACWTTATVIICLKTQVRKSVKMLTANIAGLITFCTMICYYSLIDFNPMLLNISLQFIYSIVCLIFVFGVFASTIILIMNDIFSKSSRILDSLYALIISIIGSIATHFLKSLDIAFPFSNIIKYPLVFGVMFAIYILCSAVSIMSIAYKIIFKKTETLPEDESTIDIDKEIGLDDSSFFEKEKND